MTVNVGECKTLPHQQPICPLWRTNCRDPVTQNAFRVWSVPAVPLRSRWNTSGKDTEDIGCTPSWRDGCHLPQSESLVLNVNITSLHCSRGSVYSSSLTSSLLSTQCVYWQIQVQFWWWRSAVLEKSDTAWHATAVFFFHAWCCTVNKKGSVPAQSSCIVTDLVCHTSFKHPHE